MTEATTITQRIANWVRTQRSAQGISGAELARQMTKYGINWNRTSVVKLEKGHRASLTVDELVALASCLGVLPQSLLTNDCSHCNGTPPDGFTCNACGRGR